MLALKNITKDYRIGDTVVQALKGVSMGFRANEFVSILGPSGCGKTTLLNIIGGLDRYTTGDLCIGGKSTTRFRDHEWDTYRNHSIGFVFQSYNLIPHQTVLTNVELALTISGVSKAERRRRAVQALERVGLGDQLDKKPTQMSGGQMQRVAIARAIVNDPEILLADEPTGALDTATSLQIMEILREIASDRLVIMVTHNPELAEAYSTRIIRLQDGVLLSDSDPFEVEKAEKPAKEKAAKKKKPLSLKTALSLSLNNLMTKKGRTFLTSFAGSIGIIGIALILSLSAGINAFIDDVQEDALSSYPITLQQETTDFSSMFSAMVDAENSANRPVQDGIIYVDDSLVNMMSSMMSTTKNDLAAFKKHLEANRDKLGDALSDVRYTYNFNMQIYSSDGNTRVNPTTIVDNMGESVSGMIDMMSSANSLYASTYTSTMNMFREMMDNTELLQSQYDVIAGEWAYNSNEVMLVVNENNTVTNLMLYVLGLMDQSELSELVNNVLAGNKIDVEYPTYTYEDFLGMTFYIVPNSDFYVKTDATYQKDGNTYPIWSDIRETFGFDQASFAKEHGVEVKIAGIIRPNPDAMSTSLMAGTIAYNSALAYEIMDLVRVSEIAIQQTETTPDYDVLSGLPFNDGRYDNLTDSQKIFFFDAWLSGNTKAKAEIALSLLGAEAGSIAKDEVAAMTREQQTAYVMEHFMDLAKVEPQVFKALVLSLMQATMGEEYEQYKAYFESMAPEQFVEMMQNSGEMNPGNATPENLQAMAEYFASLSQEDVAAITTALYAAKLAENMEAELLERFTTAELAAKFDELYPNLPEEEKVLLYKEYMPPMVSDSTLPKRSVDLGFVDLSSPASISLYSKDFESKDLVSQFIADYNASVGENDAITYTDLVGIMLSSVTVIINAISYVLIAFVSISLVVSSIMIGIITYISVLERTKEIGILRAIGASKKDISRVFNAETFIVGFCAGAIGLIVTVLLCFPINAIIHAVSGIQAINAALPLVGALALMFVSIFFTFVAGLVPSKIAAKKDPVLALRAE